MQLAQLVGTPVYERQGPSVRSATETHELQGCDCDRLLIIIIITRFASNPLVSFQ
jgi:hypothetical protein